MSKKKRLNSIKKRPEILRLLVPAFAAEMQVFNIAKSFLRIARYAAALMASVPCELQMQNVQSYAESMPSL